MANRIFGKRDLYRQNRRKLRAGETIEVPKKYWRPPKREDCIKGPRPCPFVACKHHLFLDVTPRGGLRVPHGDDPEVLKNMTDTCSLDVAEQGGITLESVAKLQGITRERVRQIELMALKRLQAALAHVVEEEDRHLLLSPSEEHREEVMKRLAKGVPKRPRVDLSSFLAPAGNDADAPAN